VSFEPSGLNGGEYHLAVGTAGSATLVLQTILPALLTARRPSRLTIEGGTHNPYAPPFDFHVADVPAGAAAHGCLGRRTAGGARLLSSRGRPNQVAIEPCQRLVPVALLDRGPARIQARAVMAALPESIGKRELRVVRERLGLDKADCGVEHAETSIGPGNVLLIVVAGALVTEVITGFGVKGVAAERVASDACDEAERYLRSDVPVGCHLADQLLIPLALAGRGSFRTLTPTPHTLTNASVIQRFLEVPIAMDPETPGVCRITVGGGM